MNPFPLSGPDYDAFMSDAGWTTLAMLPSWGGIIGWRGRFILVYHKPGGTYALTDISGGIPDAGVPGGMIPVSVLIENVPRTEPSTLGVYFYSLPYNFYEVAKEKSKALASDIGDVIEPVLPGLGIVALLAIAALVFVYVPRPAR